MPNAYLRLKRSTVLLVVQSDDERKYITLPVKLTKPSHWSAKTKKVSKKEPDFMRINEYLAGALAKAQGAIGEVVRSGYYDISMLKSAARRAVFPESSSVKAQHTFTDYCAEIIAGHEAEGRHERAETLRIAVRHLHEFTGHTIQFRDLEPALFRRFSSFLAYQFGNAHNTRVKKLKGIKSIVNKARKEKYLHHSQNPFDGIPLVEVPGKKVRLSRDELTRIENLELEKNSPVWHARNFFCLQVYLAGTRVSDLITLKWSSIKGELGKDARVDLRQIKSKADVDFLVSRSAAGVLGFYEERRERKVFVFPYLDGEDVSTKKREGEVRDKVRSKINKQLAEVERLAEIPKHITSHVARHTFADLAQKASMDVYLISKALGHKSIKQTQTYLASFDTAGVDRMINDLF